MVQAGVALEALERPEGNLRCSRTLGLDSSLVLKLPIDMLPVDSRRDVVDTSGLGDNTAEVELVVDIPEAGLVVDTSEGSVANMVEVLVLDAAGDLVVDTKGLAADMTDILAAVVGLDSGVGKADNTDCKPYALVDDL